MKGLDFLNQRYRSKWAVDGAYSDIFEDGLYFLRFSLPSTRKHGEGGGGGVNTPAYRFSVDGRKRSFWDDIKATVTEKSGKNQTFSR